MTERSGQSPFSPSSLEFNSQSASASVILIGLLVLIGWIFDIAILKSVFPGLVTMKANAAVAFIFAGLGLALVAKAPANLTTLRIGQACVFAVALLGLLTLSEYILGWDLGIDQLLFTEPPEAVGTFFPGRMGLNTALNFLLLGLALLLLDTETAGGHRPAQFLTLTAGLVGLVALVGYAYSVTGLIRVASYTQMALHTAIAFVALSVAILCARPDRGLVSILTGEGLGSVSARRLLPAAVAIPVILGWLHVASERLQLADDELAMSLVAVSTIVFLGAMILRHTALQNQMDVSRTEAEGALRESEQRFRIIAETITEVFWMADPQIRRMIYISPAYERAWGRSLESLYENPRSFIDAIHEEDRERVLGLLQVQKTGQPFDHEYRIVRPDGTIRWIWDRGFPVPDKTRRITRYVGVARDITERKRAEQDIKARYAELRTLHEISQDVLNSLDLQAILDGMLDKIFSIGAFDIGVIRLLEPGGKTLKVMTSRGYRNPENIRSISGDMGSEAAGLVQGQVLASKGALVVENVPASPGLMTFKTEGVHSAIVVPVRAGDEMLGTIQLGSRKPRKFQAAEVRLLEAIGCQMGIAVQKARLYDQTQSQLQSLKLLVAGARGLMANLDVETLAKDILETVANSFGFPLAWIGRAEPDGLVRPLDWIGEVGDYLSSVEIRWDESPLGQGPSGRAIRARRPVVMDIAQDPAFALWREPALAKGYRSIAAFPLIAGEKPFGVLILYSHEPDFFTQERVELIQSYSYIAAGALENARLLEETRASKSELESINRRLEKSLREISGLYTVLTPLSEKETFHAVLDGIIEKLMAATGADAALIRLRDNSTGNFILATQRGIPDFYLETTAVTDASSAAVRVFETDEPIIAADIASDPRLTGKVQLKVGLRSCAFLPLKVRNEIRGIVHLASRAPGYFNEEQREHLMAIARQMSIALENQELFEKLKASNIELVGANRIKDEFLSVMSHELRTPLSVITGYAGMMKERMMGEITPMQDEALRKMLGRAADQINMINSIMQTTQLEARAMVVERHPTDLTDLLLHLKSDYAVTQEKTGVTLIWDYPAKPAPIVTDSGKLRQILQNLIDNALKFTDRGSVTISMRLVKGKRHGARPAADDSEKSVEFRVTDTGVGIAPDKLQLIFDKFYQIDSSETRLYGGVGLGLYIVKNFTALLGGQIEVKSEPDKGSTFIVRIPYENVTVSHEAA